MYCLYSTVLWASPHSAECTSSDNRRDVPTQCQLCVWCRPAAGRPKDSDVSEQRHVEPSSTCMWRYRGWSHPHQHPSPLPSFFSELFSLLFILSYQWLKAATARNRCCTAKCKNATWTRAALWSSSAIKATTWWESLWLCVLEETHGAPRSPPANVRVHTQKHRHWCDLPAAMSHFVCIPVTCDILLCSHPVNTDGVAVVAPHRAHSLQHQPL